MLSISAMRFNTPKKTITPASFGRVASLNSEVFVNPAHAGSAELSICGYSKLFWI